MAWLALLAGVLSLGIATYLLPWLVVTFLCGPRDLKKRYNAQWGLVTGSSSGERACAAPSHLLSSSANLD